MCILIKEIFNTSERFFLLNNGHSEIGYLVPVIISCVIWESQLTSASTFLSTTF